MAKNLETRKNRAQLVFCAIMILIVVALSSFLSARVTATSITFQNPSADAEEQPEAATEYRGNTEVYSDDGIEDDGFYSSGEGLENAILITGGKLSANSISVKKSGDAGRASAFVSGANAAILLNGGELNLVHPTIDTGGSFATGLFVNNGTTAKVSKSNIITTGDYSNGVTVNEDGRATLDDAIISTSGDRSAALRVGEDAGKITVTGGQFKTTGKNSPIVYAAAEGVVMQRAKMEASNSSSITLVQKGKTYFGFNNIIGGADSDTKAGEPKQTGAIFLYQPVDGSGAGTVQLDLERNTVTTKKVPFVNVTNTGAKISLKHNSFVYPEGAKEQTFMEIGAADSYGSTSDKKAYGGASVTLNASDQYILGDIKVDRASTLSMVLEDASRYVGALNTDNTALRVTLSLSKDSTIVLTGDTYVDILSNGNENNTNIYANGFALYVAGEKVRINSSEKVPSYNYNLSETGPNADVEQKTEVDNSQALVIVGAVAVIVIALVLIVVVAIKMRSGKKQKINQQIQMQNDARARLEAQMRAQEQNPDFGKNQYPNVHV